MITRKARTVVAITLLFAGCVSSNIPKELADEIPKGAKAIKLYSVATPEELYRSIFRKLAADGFSIENENQEMGTLSTGYKDVGQQTALRINVFVDEAAAGSVALFRGEWAVTSSMATAYGGGGTSADAAEWGKTGRPSVAFGAMALFVEQIPASKVEYLQS